MTSAHPYQSLDNTRFWKTAVTEIDFNDGFAGLWTPKFQIGRDARILTLGSCFAQHIGRWLVQNGYTWQDCEPPSEVMAAQERLDHGHGQYSFRTGNVYTVAQLRQWLEMALHTRTLEEGHIEEDGRFFDPMRPQIPRQGLASLAELHAARQRTLDAMIGGFQTADLFIFTLGLTESWVSPDGQVHPVCPGTIRGAFDPARHTFRNDTHDSIRDDLRWIIDELKCLNPHIRILLTVSPVPLTATAADMHVLTATTYSKSVLRCVAGELAKGDPQVDYFPSYEIISGIPTKARFFEANLRSVTAQGVEFVMRHFSAGLSGAGLPTLPPYSSVSKQNPEDVVCEEILLESWQRHSHEDESPTICLLGDSHMGMISKSLAKRQVPHRGGMIMNGSAWTSNLLHLDPVEYFVPLEDAGARDRWRQTLPFFQVREGSGPNKKLVVSNIGMQTHRSVSHFVQWLGKRELSEELFCEYFFEENRRKLTLLKQIAEIKGVTVVLMTDPPTQSINSAVAQHIRFWQFYDDMAEKVFNHLGYSVFHARRHFQTCGFLPDYHSQTVYADGTRDWFHGSELYYDAVTEALLDWAHRSGSLDVASAVAH